MVLNVVEFIEIHNDIGVEIDLIDVYLVDFNIYYEVQDGSVSVGVVSNDFLVCFFNGVKIVDGVY